MSLINNMLQGLERRREETGSGDFDPVLGELSAVDHEELMSRKRASGLGLWAVAFLVLLVFLFSLFSINLEKEGAVPEPDTVRHEPVTDTIPGNTNIPDAGPVPDTNHLDVLPGEKDTYNTGISLKLDHRVDVSRKDAQSEENNDALIFVDHIRMNGEGNNLNLSLSLPVKAEYLMYTLPEPHKVVLELRNARYNGALPDISGLDGVNAIRQRVENDGTYKLVLESEREILIDKAGMDRADEGYVLQVNMAYAPDPESMVISEIISDDERTDSEHAGTFNKSPVGKSERPNRDKVAGTASRVDVLVYEGRKLYQEGKIREGISRLIKAVEREPEHAGARKSLAVLLLEQGRRAEAKELLVEGLRINPGQPEWVRVLARILYDEDNLKQARAVLEGAAPPLRTNLDYHALYAGILQSMGEHARAAIVYRNLLKYGGNNGSWWLGLAISLEAMARNSDAVVAYRNALNAPEIKTESERFIKNRLENLDQKS